MISTDIISYGHEAVAAEFYYKEPCLPHPPPPSADWFRGERYLVTPHSCMAPLAYGIEDRGQWYDQAIHLDTYTVSDAPEVAALTDAVFSEVIVDIEANVPTMKTRSKKAFPRLRQTLQVIILNLYFAYLLAVPVMYFRDKNRYSKNKRYGRLFFQYERVLAVVDALRRLGYICHKNGNYYKDKGIAKTSRMWAASPLIRMFNQVHIHQPRRIYSAERSELIELRDDSKNKRSIDYPETAETRQMRDNLCHYNKFICGQNVEVQVDGRAPISLTQLDIRIYRGLLKGDFTLLNLQLDKYSFNVTRGVTIGRYPYTTVYRTNNTNNSGYYITHTFFDYSHIINGLEATKKLWWSGDKYTSTAALQPGENKKYLPLLKYIIKERYRYNQKFANNASKDTKAAKKLFGKLNTEKMSLYGYGISKLGLALNDLALHRVFNNGEFQYGGRFYANYQTLPKKFRKHIVINGEPTVEWDYAAHHIRIAYHKEGIDYREDPYMAMTGDKSERTVFKLLSLVVINAEDDVGALQGFRNSNRAKLKELLGDLTDATLKPLLDRFREAHPKITHYLHSGAGVEFQNIDSRITERILMEMTAQGIPCLPIHDSYIVPVRHQECLKQAMIACYKEEMGFEPVIDN